jgi:hypothetical protein
MLTKAQIRELPEFIALPKKHQQYVTFVTMWDKTHTAACRLLKLNRKRVAENPLIHECIAAIRQGVRPPTPAPAPEATLPVNQTIQLPAVFSHSLPSIDQAAFFEGVRRLARDRGMWREAEDPQFMSTTLIRTNGDALLPDSEVSR